MDRLTEKELEELLKQFEDKLADDEISERMIASCLQESPEPLLTDVFRERLVAHVLVMHEKKGGRRFLIRLLIRFCIYLVILTLTGFLIFFILSVHAAMSVLNTALAFKWPILFFFALLPLIEYFHGILVGQKILAFRREGAE